MNKLKYAVGSAGATAALVMGLAAPVGATQQEGPRGGGDTTTTHTVSIDRSLNVNGNCSGIIQTDVGQSQSSETDQTEVSGGGLAAIGGNNNSSNSQSSSTTQGQSADVNFTPNCSTTNVTQQVAAAPVAAAPQVAAPSGGVHAGGGAGVSSASSLSALLGLTGSVGTAGIGLALRKRALEL